MALQKHSNERWNRSVKFTKMHGIGNDYLYINCFDEGVDHDWSKLSCEASDRHFGVGSDGIILVMPSRIADFRMRIFNSDGSEADMCGNGIRCFSRLVYDRGLTKKTELTVETRSGIMKPVLLVDNGSVTSVRVNMGKPSLRPEDVPMTTGSSSDAIDVPLEALGKHYSVTGVRMGNPNGVIFVDDLDTIDLPSEGAVLEVHPAFPRKANIEFTKVVDRNHIEMKVWERGSGITLACGTGSCACLVASAATGRSSRAAEISLPGGKLFVEWAPDGDVYMTGPAEEICTGDYVKWKEGAR